jgi:hypothetical protein
MFDLEDDLMEDAPEAGNGPEAGRRYLFVVALLILLALYGYSEKSRAGGRKSRDRLFRESIVFDDEPLEDEDLAAIRKAREERYAPLDDYFERRAGRAS